MLTTLIASAALQFVAPASFAPTWQAAPAAVATEQTSFIRNDVAADGTISVQTAAHRLTSPGKPDLWLVPVIHIGLADYYKSVQGVLNDRDMVLYEGVKPGKDQLEAKKKAEETGATEEKGKDLYAVFGKAIGLDFQKDHVTYKSHWINSDLSWDEMRAFSKESGSDTVSNLEGMLQSGSSSAAMMETLFSMPIPGLTEAIKVFMVKQLGSSETTKNPLTSDPGFQKVIIDERNKVVERDFAKLMSGEKKPTSIGIIYGAAHHPSFYTHFSKEYGYKVVESKWFTAAQANPNELSEQGKQMLQLLERSAPQVGGGL